MILSVTLRSLHALVSHLCPIGLPEVAMPYFWHVARLSDNTPAHHAMLCQVELSVGRPPGPSWKCPPGRPRTKWTDQVHQDNNSVPIATVEASYWSWSLESDATVRANYALTTATTIILTYSYCEELRNQNETLRNAYTTAACCIQVQMVACLCGCRFVDELGCVFVHKQWVHITVRMLPCPVVDDTSHAVFLCSMKLLLCLKFLWV